MIDIIILQEYKSNGLWHVTYKYWIKGDCACTAEKKKVSFSFKPSMQDMIDAI